MIDQGPVLKTLQEADDVLLKYEAAMEWWGEHPGVSEEHPEVSSPPMVLVALRDAIKHVSKAVRLEHEARIQAEERTSV